MTHGLNRCQADHLPDSNVNTRRGARQPDLIPLQLRHLRLTLQEGLMESRDDGAGDWAGPEVVEPISRGAAAKAGLVQVHASRCRVSIIHQAPERFPAAVFPTEPPQPAQYRLDLNR